MTAGLERAERGFVRVSGGLKRGWESEVEEGRRIGKGFDG